MNNPRNESLLRIGVSSCLLGEPVRYDGGHKRNDFLADKLGPFVEWVPVCPEVELGLGTPREPIELVGTGDAIRLQATRSGQDLTDRMRQFAARRADELAGEQLSGFVLKSGSPSCGVDDVPITRDGTAGEETAESLAAVGTGMFAAALEERLPNLPLEVEDRLSDPARCSHWLERVFVYHALQSLWRQDWELRDLIAFHTRHKYQILAHHEARYRQLGRIVAAAKGIPRDDLRRRYESEVMAALKAAPTVGRISNVFQHVLGHFSHQLDYDERQHFIARIYDLRRGTLSFEELRCEFRDRVAQLQVTYLENQSFLNPDPREVALRNVL